MNWTVEKKEQKTYAQHEFYYFDRNEFFFRSKTNERDWKQQRVFKIHITQKSVPQNFAIHREKIPTHTVASHAISFACTRNHTITFFFSFSSILYNFHKCTFNSKEFEKNKDRWNYLHRLKIKKKKRNLNSHPQVNFKWFYFLCPQLCFLCVQLNEKPDVELQKKNKRFRCS